METIWQNLLTLNGDLVIIFQDANPKEMGAYVLQKISTKCFIAALFIIAKNTKNSMCPSTGE